MPADQDEIGSGLDQYVEKRSRCAASNRRNSAVATSASITKATSTSSSENPAAGAWMRRIGEPDPAA